MPELTAYLVMETFAVTDAARNAAFPTTAIVSWHEPALTPVIAYPPAMARTLHVADEVVT